jgi:hypothetical protein
LKNQVALSFNHTYFCPTITATLFSGMENQVVKNKHISALLPQRDIFSAMENEVV